jgi:cytochrome c oxidase cbb3-type subunit 3
VALSVVYMVNYHVLPTPAFGKAGMVAEYEAEMAAARARTASRTDGAEAPAVALAALTDAASLEAGRALYDGADNACSSCHRPDLGGMIGPSLADDHWLHGCSVEAVVSSIRTGYPLKGMMPFGTTKALDETQLLQLASFILSKRGSAPPDPKPIDPERDVVCP